MGATDILPCWRQAIKREDRTKKKVARPTQVMLKHKKNQTAG